MNTRRTTVATGTAQPRGGAVLVEGAIVFVVLFTVLLVTFDLALVSLRHNVLAEAARRLARAAIVHGDRAAPDTSVWGPDSYSGTADDGSAMAAAVLPILVTLDPAAVAIELKWPNDSNTTDDRVDVSVSAVHDPIVPFLFGGPLKLKAGASMWIEH